MKSVKLLSKWVGDGYPCYVVAEIGNLFKNFEEAKRLIDSAKEAGVDAVKFQTWDAETLTTKNNYFDLEITGHVSQYEFHKKIQISKELQMQLVKYAKENGVTIFSAPSHISDLKIMEEMDLPIYKVGSDLACHIPLLRKIARFGKPLILSTGMCTMEEVKQSVNTILNEGNDQIILLHCVSDYPAKIEESNLRAILEMKKEFDLPVGFSDHTIGKLTAISATALGANVIEKHMKHPLNLPSPDDIHAMTPEQFSDLVKSIRLTESTVGSGKKNPSKSEINNLKNNRVSIISLTKIKKGDLITKDRIDVRRPGTGIQPIHFDTILGKKAKVDIPMETPLQWDMIE